MRKIRPHITYANVVATLALFAVLAGGGAYAAKKLKLKRNAVKTRNIKDGAVTGPKIADGAVSEGKIANEAVKTGRIGDKAVKHGKLGELAVENDKIAPGAVSADKTDFIAESGRVHSNPAANQTLTPTLISAGGVAVTGTCHAGATLHDSHISIDAPAGSRLNGIATFDGGAPAPMQTAAFPTDTIGFAPLNTAISGYVVASVITPARAVQLTIHSVLNPPDAGCAFSATAIVG